MYFRLCYRFYYTCKHTFWGKKILNATWSSGSSFYREICVCLTTVAGNALVAGRNGVINTINRRRCCALLPINVEKYAS